MLLAAEDVGDFHEMIVENNCKVIRWNAICFHKHPVANILRFECNCPTNKVFHFIRNIFRNAHTNRMGNDPQLLLLLLLQLSNYGMLPPYIGAAIPDAFCFSRSASKLFCRTETFIGMSTVQHFLRMFRINIETFHLTIRTVWTTDINGLIIIDT